MKVRRFRLMLALLIAPGMVAAIGSTWLWGIARWQKVPVITIVARANDPRLPAVREAVDFWNATLAALPTPFHLGAVTRVDGSIPEADLQNLSDSSPQGLWIKQHPTPFAAIDGDLLIVLSDADFVSFTSRIGDRTLIAIKSASVPPLSLPNVLANVIAHEIGHALGLPHNSDPAMLMCGRPAPCRPASFIGNSPRMFPLTPADIARLHELYPAAWPAQ
jgi:hypothetical protein